MRFKLPNHEEWHEWYAWYPILKDSEIVWLEKIDRIWIPCFTLAKGGYWSFRNIHVYVQYISRKD